MTGVDRTKIRENLDSFSACTDVPVTLYDPEGTILAEYLPQQKFCQFFPQYTSSGSECRETLVFSARQAFEMGEPYIYYCPVGLVHIAVPVLENGKALGCAVAGPLIMGDSDERLLDQTMELNALTTSQLSRAALFSAQMRRFPPAMIQKLASLLYSAVLHGQQNMGDYALAAARHRKQLAMGEQIQARKRASSALPPALPLAEQEDRFVELVRARDLEGALECQRRLLDELILVEGGNFDAIKMHVLEVFLSLIRIAIDSGVPLRKMFGGDLSFLTGLSEAENVEALSEWSRETTKTFATEIFAGLSPLSATTAKAVAYLNDHYMDKITLRELAGKLFVSDSYLSKLFRQELGTSFTDYLNKSRVEHSIDYMQGTDMSLLEISGMVGFEDQSYFTKVFKRITGETPRQYKNRLINGKGSEEA